MKKFEVVRNYLFCAGWEEVEGLDEIETFEMKTQKEAINYFEKKYGPIIDINSKDFYSKYKNTISVYELYTVPEYDDEYGDTNIIATAIAK